MQCSEIINGKRCIWPSGHGGNHYAPLDNQDHSDEIRIQVLRDDRDAMKQKLLDLSAALEEEKKRSLMLAEHSAQNAIASARAALDERKIICGDCGVILPCKRNEHREGCSMEDSL